MAILLALVALAIGAVAKDTASMLAQQRAEIASLRAELAEARAEARERAQPRPARSKYNTKGGPRPGVINVHMVPHSHDDGKLH